MNKLEALKELEKSVSAGKYPGGPWTYHVNGYANSAYNGSLDAAKALHEAVLTDNVEALIVYTGRYGCHVTISDQGSYLSEASSEGSPARAWLLADIRALIAIEEEKQ